MYFFFTLFPFSHSRSSGVRPHANQFGRGYWFHFMRVELEAGRPQTLVKDSLGNWTRIVSFPTREVAHAQAGSNLFNPILAASR